MAPIRPSVRGVVGGGREGERVELDMRGDVGGGGRREKGEGRGLRRDRRRNI